MPISKKCNNLCLFLIYSNPNLNHIHILIQVFDPRSLSSLRCPASSYRWQDSHKTSHVDSTRNQHRVLLGCQGFLIETRKEGV